MNKILVTNYAAYNERADEVNFDVDNISYLVQDMKDTMKTNDLVYLCAPQIDVHKRVICIKFSEEDFRVYVNPCITQINGRPGFNIETSVSVPDAKFAVLRNPEIHVTYQEADGTVHPHPVQFLGMSAMYMQQLIDILDGRLICDGSMPILDGWDDLKQEEQDELFSLWLKQQTENAKAFEENIKDDVEVNNMLKSIEFWKSVQEGKTILDTED